MAKSILERAVEQSVLIVFRDLARTALKKGKELLKTASNKKKTGKPLTGKETEKYDDDEAVESETIKGQS